MKKNYSFRRSSIFKLHIRALSKNVIFEIREYDVYKNKNVLWDRSILDRLVSSINQSLWWKRKKTHLTISLLFLFKDDSKYYYKIFLNNKD